MIPEKLHEFETHRDDWKSALVQCLSAADSSDEAHRWGNLLDVYNKAMADLCTHFIAEEFKKSCDDEHLNAIYNQRNTAVIALATAMSSLGYRAGHAVTPADERPEWNENWRTVVYIELGAGEQISYHMNDDTGAAARLLPRYPFAWNGKYTGRDAPAWLDLIRVAHPIDITSVEIYQLLLSHDAMCALVDYHDVQHSPAESVGYDTDFHTKRIEQLKAWCDLLYLADERGCTIKEYVHEMREKVKQPNASKSDALFYAQMVQRLVASHANQEWFDKEPVKRTPRQSKVDYSLKAGDEVYGPHWGNGTQPMEVVSVNWALQAVALLLRKDGGTNSITVNPCANLRRTPYTPEELTAFPGYSRTKGGAQ